MLDVKKVGLDQLKFLERTVSKCPHSLRALNSPTLSGFEADVQFLAHPVLESSSSSSLTLCLVATLRVLLILLIPFILLVISFTAQLSLFTRSPLLRQLLISRLHILFLHFLDWCTAICI